MTADQLRPHLTAIGEVLISLQSPTGTDLAGTDTLHVRIAGAEANFAAAFIRAGGTAALCSAVGQDPFGDQVLRRLGGAGDAFAGTYCGLRAFGESPLAAGRVSAAVAARVVGTAGDLDGLPSAGDMRRLLAEHRW